MLPYRTRSADKKPVCFSMYARRKLNSRRFLLLLIIFLILFIIANVFALWRRSINSPLRRSSLQVQYAINIKPNIVPIITDLSRSLAKRNLLPPRNLERFPTLKEGHIIIVLYVHNRPKYLKAVLKSLSNVVGIDETLLIVSHDGYFEEMNSLVEGIRFCQVKQIFAPYSPHLFPNSFPDTTAGDCTGKQDARFDNCTGNPDQYRNHRETKIVSLKHHWWWMMNTVWDGLEETRNHQGHILFIEEDHYIFPNAYRNIQILISLKQTKCSDCYFVNLSPPYGFGSEESCSDCLIADDFSNIGYTFNRTVWWKIRQKSREFCYFDDYNWDITMDSAVFPSWGSPFYTLRGPRRSAMHFGNCGLHVGKVGQNVACIDDRDLDFKVMLEEEDSRPNIDANLEMYVSGGGIGKAGFKGNGGWGDERDRQLCMDFSSTHLIG